MSNSKCTPKLLTAMTEKILQGHHLETVAQSCEITPNTLWSWSRRAKSGEAPYADFMAAIRVAQAEAEIQLGNTALAGDGAGQGNGMSKSAQWMLERTRAKRFGPKIDVKVQNEVAVFLDVAETVLDVDSFERLLEAISEVDGEGIPIVLLGESATRDEIARKGAE